jgi:hypothetical protein
MAIAGFVTGYCTLALAVLILPALLLPALSKAKGKAQEIKCVNNLKSVGLAARLWATDHDERLPSNFVEFKAELATPKILWCPNDKTHTPAMDWNGYSPANVSYVIVSPGTTNQDSSTVFARCPIHGHEVMVDGSVNRKAALPIK